MILMMINAQTMF